MIRLWGALAALLATTACAPGSPAAVKTPAPSTVGAAGTVVAVGLTTDLPGWGWLNTGTNTRSGFDYDLMNWFSDQMHFTPTPVDVTLDDRLPAVQSGRTPLMLANLAMTDERRKLVGFAGPYMIDQQGVLTRKGDDRISAVGDLAGMTICTARNTTSLAQLNEGALSKKVTIVERMGYAECVQNLKAHQVDAVVTDQLTLVAFAAQDPAALQVRNVTFGAQDRYGVGLPHGDTASCLQFTRYLKTFITSGAWDIFFAKYFPGQSAAGHKPDPSQLTPCQ